MTEKDIQEAPEAADELTDTEIEDAAGGAISSPGTIYNVRPGVKLD